MYLLVKRRWFTAQSTVGELWIDGVFECYTLEPRKDQSQGKPYAIPAGTYPVTLERSPHFQIVTPHLGNVPGFDEIEIHPGNFPSDTKGCTLVGELKGTDAVLSSRAAFDALMKKLAAPITIAYAEVPDSPIP